MVISSDNAIFGAQVVGGASFLYAASDLLLPNAGPCYTPTQQGGFVADPNRGLSMPAIVFIGVSLFYTGASLAGIVAHKVHRAFFHSQQAGR